ncbi:MULTISPECIES: PH domain-containing protein [unclassified Nocardioides]|uniref:PH domain-containing protein n=1 Tax=unclassified Nocardioides TaxID=2615069 RepID=UPI0009F08C7C|nr:MULTISPECIES: PH domain-containing protein [unclassified Nocardioides]GAW50780.1 membrane-flanked domain-containing protein [Nocardioides sp. PD653-B2]GAW52719.1 membrane-flanked domain-containing protein [Nocardioides sp. PD653]
MAISRKLLNEGETVIVDTRTHVKALILPIFMLVLLLAVGTWVQTQVDHDLLSKVVWVAVAVGIIWFVVRPFVIWATATYTFTDRRLITRSGVIVRRGHDMPLARISDIAYEFGPIDRLLGCGTLLISDASTHGTVKLHDIPQVEEVQRQVNQLLQGIHDTSSGHDGT